MPVEAGAFLFRLTKQQVVSSVWISRVVISWTGCSDFVFFLACQGRGAVRRAPQAAYILT